jgi:hypothetical protein
MGIPKCGNCRDLATRKICHVGISVFILHKEWRFMLGFKTLPPMFWERGGGEEISEIYDASDF